MAYIYNKNTGEFDITPDDVPGPGGPGDPGQDPPPSNWKKWLKIAGGIVLPIIGTVIVSATGIPIFDHE